MRIATFNLESLDLPPKASVALEERAEILRPQLERVDADILCLQEVNAQRRSGAEMRTLEALDSLLAGTKYERYARASTSGPAGHGAADVHNLVTLSRWPIERHSEVRHTLVPPLAYQALTANPREAGPATIGFERPLLLCEIAGPDHLPLAVLNVHLRAPLAAAIAGQKEAPFVWKSVSGWAEGYFLSAWKRSAQALEARLAIDRLFDADAQRPIVVAGDFNAEDHETALKSLVGAEEDTGNGRLAVRSLVVLDRSLAEDRRYSTVHHGRPQMLDHILVSRPLLGRFRSIEAHNETLADEIAVLGITRRAGGSYHAPVVAEFAAG
jgi:endonuclease/exonuclease/phosphatase family metal-dependent hydrolase